MFYYLVLGFRCNDEDLKRIALRYIAGNYEKSEFESLITTEKWEHLFVSEPEMELAVKNAVLAVLSH